ncbi:Endonuclease/exonuclease/phosphatase [Chaetomium sp. MPI-SDFR-AT-0129]|nr:Endonuclease/exonuclease/phosphatase [Chaetomium sp. MPI-SDFR-AT-0129]
MEPPDPPEPESPTSANPYSLSRAVHARRSEYVRPHRIRIKVGTWNVAACPGTDKDLAQWFIDGKGLDPALGSSADPPKGGSGSGDDGHDATGGAENPIQLTDGDKIGLYVLGLQEVNILTAPGQYMGWIYSDDSTLTRWKTALEAGLPAGYEFVSAQQLAGMLLLAYAAPEIAPTISNVNSTYVGTGALGIGNKGAVCTRVVLGETTQLLFVNCHLASGVEDYYLGRRIAHAQQITAQASFEPIVVSGVSEDEKSKIGDEDVAFWFGDLNFRLENLPGDDIRRLLMLHTQGEYDLSKKMLRRESSLEGEPVVVHRLSDSSDETSDPDAKKRPPKQPEDEIPNAKGENDADSLDLPDPDEFLEDPHQDPASLQATLDSLLPHDQLGRLRKQRQVFHEGWQEGPITFLPTYKYDVGTVTLFDSSEKQRAPSWCDRVLYRTRRDREVYQRKAQQEADARERDEEMKARGIADETDDDVLFSYDPENDGEEQPKAVSFEYDEYDEGEDDGDDPEPNEATSHNKLRLDLYTSHQRITSSDHKPVTTIFTLDYDAVVPDLKATVHAEVARELDRAENEGRPGITIVVDQHQPGTAAQGDGPDGALHVDFGEVQFLKKYSSTLTLANTSGVPATLSFVESIQTDDDKPDHSAQTQWLTTLFLHSEPANDDTESVDLGKEVTLEPGETLNAVLDCVVSDVKHAQMLNEGQSTLEEVLVLRIQDGRDHFIPVHASWAPSCIGRSIEELIRVPEGKGIRAFATSISTKTGRIGPIPYDLPAHRPAPKELFILTSAIENATQRVLADAQILDDCVIPSDPGWPFDEATCHAADVDTRASHVLDLLNALDRDETSSPNLSAALPAETSSLARLEALAQTLLLFLRGLTDGIIPTHLWQRIEQAATSTPPSLPTVTNPSAALPALDDDDNHHNNSISLDSDRSTIHEIVQSTSPHHNICFVFLTAMLARVVTDLAPMSNAEWDALQAAVRAVPGSATIPAGVKGIGGVLGGVGRKSLSFVKRGTASSILSSGTTGDVGSGVSVVDAFASLEKRRVRERKVAEVFGPVVCRGLEEVQGTRERKVAGGRRRVVLELFVRRRGADRPGR